MKKLTLITMIFVLFLGTRCYALENAKATFHEKHECHAMVGLHASRCKIIDGDTLSKNARAVYGDWHLYPAIAAANGSIVDVNKIESGKWIVIPDEPLKDIAGASPTSRVQTPEIDTPASAFLMSVERIRPTIDAETAVLEYSFDSTPIVSNDFSRQTEAETIQPVAPLPKPATLPSRKTTCYQVAVSGVLRGQLETQLILFNSEDERKLELPSERIAMKPSLAVPAKDGSKTIIFVHLKQLPAQPFQLLIGGVSNTVMSTDLLPYNGKTPGENTFLRAAITVGKMAARGGISLATTGNPFIATGVAVGPILVNLAIEHHQKSRARKLAAAQAAVDKSKLALYRASIESIPLSSKEN